MHSSHKCWFLLDPISISEWSQIEISSSSLCQLALANCRLTAENRNTRLQPVHPGSWCPSLLICCVTLHSWLPHFSPNWRVQAEEVRGRLLALLPWTLSVARQPERCCGSGVQRSSGSLWRAGCAPTHTPHTQTNTQQRGETNRERDREENKKGWEKLNEEYLILIDWLLLENYLIL